MKFNFKSASALFTAGVLFLSGCSLNQMVKLAEEQELTVVPNPLELHGDSVQFEVSAVLPVKMLKKNKLYTIKTYYTYGDPTQNLEKFEFTDVEFPNQKVEEPSKVQNFSMFFEDDMKDGDLMIKGVASNLDKTKFKETEPLKIADGVITTSRLVQYAYDVAYADHGYNNKEELIPTSVVFHFDKGSSRLKNSEIRGTNGQELDAFIAAKNVTRTVTIYGSHSPEGLESVNSRLAEDRANVIKNFYTRKMRQYDYKGMADSIKFETVAIFQKWDKFLKELETYEGLDANQKSEIKAIVNGPGEFTAKEKELSKKPYYSKLMKDVYPKLRTSRTKILSVKQKKTDAEINVLTNSIVEGKAKADTLSHEELMYAASLTPILDEKIKIYEEAVKAHDSWNAHNNLGAAYLEKAKKTSDKDAKKAMVEEAIVSLELAANKKESAVVYNNLAACQMILGNRAESGEYFTKASNVGGATKEVKEGINAGKGSLEVRNGNYGQAISMLGGANENNADAFFNLGLAHLLQRDFASAEKAFEAALAVDENYALAYYCGAVAAARQDNKEDMGQKLSQAVSIDGSLRDRAISDLEFKPYWEDAEFISALK